MYTEFFNLKEKPFDLTPSTRFLYLGEGHKEALALLTYGVVERKGFILLTGEVGTGKTTMIQAFLANLDKNTHYVLLSNPLLSVEDFLYYLSISVFKNKSTFRSKAEFLIAFEGYLRECLQHQRNFLLLIDEAHKLSFDLLEEVRLLSNIETANQKLVNIFLVGQPELNEKLSDPVCRALVQRISIRYHIEPLGPEAVREYLETRLKLAGAANTNRIFPGDTIRAIHQFSEGYPRMINILADNAMLLGFSKGRKKITPPMVRECYEDLNLERFFPTKTQEHQEVIAINKKHTGNGGRVWKWALALMFIMALIIISGDQGIMNPVMNWADSRFRSFVSTSTAVKPSEGREMVREDIRKADNVQVPGDRDTFKEMKNEKDKDNDEDITLIPVDIKETVSQPSKNTQDQDMGQAKESSNETGRESSRTITVKPGDSLAKLALSIYGRTDEKILKMLREHNPGIQDIHLIGVGQKIFFPPLTGFARAPTFTVHIASFQTFDPAQDLFIKLIKDGHEAYIMPVFSSLQGRQFQVTAGNFVGHKEADEFAHMMIRKGISREARTISLEMR